MSAPDKPVADFVARVRALPTTSTGRFVGNAHAGMQVWTRDLIDKERRPYERTDTATTDEDVQRLRPDVPVQG